MFVKQVVAIMLVSTLICNAANGACSVERVKPDSLKQARSLIRQYDNAKTGSEKQCKEQAMRDLLNKLVIQSNDFGGAVETEAMAGELEASIVNEQEHVALKKSIALLTNKLAEIDSQKSSARVDAQKMSTKRAREMQQAVPQGDVSNKRRRLIK